MKTLIVGTDFKSVRRLKTQGQFLHEALTHYAYDVKIVSRHRNYLRRILDTVIEILKLSRYDIVIVQVYSTKGIYLECLSVLLGRLKGCKVAATLHGGNIPHQYHTNRVKRFLLNLIFRFSNYVTSPSSFIPEQIPRIKSSCILIRNIIELDQYTYRPKPGDNKIRIFWMRAYHPAYDPLKAVHIAEYLLAQHYDVEMVMAGSDHGLKDELMRYVESGKHADKFTFLDVIDNAGKNEIAASSTVYLNTNLIDNAPVSFLEMIAMGLPIVTTNIGGIPYYVTDHQTALLSADNSVENLASLILELHNNHELKNRMIANGMEFIKEFSRDSVTQKWIELIYKQHN